jgi:Leucine-rich repeat (LRR) protein
LGPCFNRCSLEKLYIADIKLTDDELELGLLKGPARSLEHLSLGNNRLERLPGKAFQDMKKLTTLSLASNKITQITREDVEPMRGLHKLALLLDKNPLHCCDMYGGVA